jgi:hypothetical protein
VITAENYELLVDHEATVRGIAPAESYGVGQLRGALLERAPTKCHKVQLRPGGGRNLLSGLRDSGICDSHRRSISSVVLLSDTTTILKYCQALATLIY